MPDRNVKSQLTPPSQEPQFSKKVGDIERRKLKAMKNQHSELWIGFAMVGVVGWAVATPTLLGIALGVWIDSHHPGKYSWTLMLLMLGLMLGCWNAGYWVAKESATIRRENEKDS